MQLLVDQFEKFSRAVLHPASGPLTDAQFLVLCEQYPDCRVETTADGDILIMPPAHSVPGSEMRRLLISCLRGPKRMAEVNHSIPARGSF